MGVVRDNLAYNGFNLRERLNIYSGLALGLAAPIAATRYFFFSGFPEFSNPVLFETFAWGSSTVGNAVASALFNGFPLAHSAMAGLFIGYNSAKKLQLKREERKNPKDITDVFVATPDDIID